MSSLVSTPLLMFCKGISKDEALAGATLLGDRVLASKALEMISVIG